jgi:hypothetical protein
VTSGDEISGGRKLRVRGLGHVADPCLNLGIIYITSSNFVVATNGGVRAYTVHR